MKASAGGFMLPFSGISAFEALSRSLGWRGALPGTPGEAMKKNKKSCHPQDAIGAGRRRELYLRIL